MTHHLNDLFDQLFAELEDQKYDKSYGHELLVIDFADVIKPLLRLKQAVLGALEPWQTKVIAINALNVADGISQAQREVKHTSRFKAAS